MAKFVTKLNHIAEEYPWKKYVPPQAASLILGTFPSAYPDRAYEFFYPNKKNRMWSILFQIAKEQFDEKLLGEPAIEVRKRVLDKLNLGMDDMALKIYRMGNSSLDLNIFPIEYNDIFATLEETPTIRKILITSSSKGSSVLNWFTHYCHLNKVKIELPKENKIPYDGQLHFGDRILRIKVVFSVSGAAGKATEELVNMYSQAILSD